jgi:hypothetical protein
VCEALKKELPLAALKRRNVIYVEKAISQVA